MKQDRSDSRAVPQSHGFSLGWQPAALLFLSMALAVFSFASPSQSEGSHPVVDPAAIAGIWEMHPLAKDSDPPAPPPVYASYKKNDPPLETVSRVILKFEDGLLSGAAVFPKGIVLAEGNRDATGQPEIPLANLVFDGANLTFSVTVEDQRLEADLSLNGLKRFDGTWKTGGKEGLLFLNRR